LVWFLGVVSAASPGENVVVVVQHHDDYYWYGWNYLKIEKSGLPYKRNINQGLIL
jgi:hypothetical protein